MGYGTHGRCSATLPRGFTFQPKAESLNALKRPVVGWEGFYEVDDGGRV